MSYSAEKATISGADSCLNVGRHVRVDAQVMQGSASLGQGSASLGQGSASLGSGAAVGQGSGFAAANADGPRPASMRSDGGARLRMDPHNGPGPTSVLGGVPFPR
ncbi:MAG: hypothetical protein ACK5JM_04485 [Rhodoblastus sp.]